MTRKLTRILAGLAVCFAAACGAPGSYDLCNASCDSFRKCGYSNESEAANCHTDCNNNKGKYADDDAELQRMCKNASDIRKQQADCYAVTSCRSGSPEYIIALGSCVADPQVNNCIKQ